MFPLEDNKPIVKNFIVKEILQRLDNDGQDDIEFVNKMADFMEIPIVKERKLTELIHGDMLRKNSLTISLTDSFCRDSDYIIVFFMDYILKLPYGLMRFNFHIPVMLDEERNLVVLNQYDHLTLVRYAEKNGRFP